MKVLIIVLGCLAAIGPGARADTVHDFDLDIADLERLGVALSRPVRIDEAEVAAGTAEVVIPPPSQAIVTAPVSGVLSQLLVAEGDFVTAGRHVAVLSSADLLHLQREYVEAAVAADLAQSQLERDLRLFEDGIIAQRRVRDSQAAARTAATALNQVARQMALAGVDDSELSVLAATGELSSTLPLKAPFDSFVIEQYAGLGARVDALDPVYRVADLSRLWLEIHVPQESSDSVRPGMRVSAATSTGTIRGTVSGVGRVVDAASQTRIVRAEISDNDSPDLLVGRFLTARIFEQAAGDASIFVVPGSAIVRVDAATYVFVMLDGALSAWPVDIVSENGTSAWVHADFGDDVEVAVAGTATLKSVWMADQDEGE